MKRTFGRRQTSGAASPSGHAMPNPDLPKSEKVEPATIGAVPPRMSVSPWRGQADEAGADLAFAHLTVSLPATVVHEDRIQPETLMAAAGAMAGLTVQLALRQDQEQLRSYFEHQELTTTTDRDGVDYITGDPIDEGLFAPGGTVTEGKLWTYLMGGALALGLPSEQIPDLGSMFAHVDRLMREGGGGQPSVAADNQPMLPVRYLVLAAWPQTKACLKGEINDPAVVAAGGAAITSWPAITAAAAGIFLTKVSSVLTPDIAMTIAMESGIYASRMLVDAEAALA